MDHNVNFGTGFGPGVEGNNSIAFSGRAPRSLYNFECLKPDGSVRWSEDAGNVVTEIGRTNLLEEYFKGAGYTASWFVGLKGSTHAVTSSDVMPSTQRDWSESTAYSDGSRRPINLGAVSSSQQSVSNSSTKSSFTINQTTEIFGAFVTNSTQISSGSTHILYGVADFDNPSSSGRSVVSGDTLNVTVTLTASTS